MSGGHFVVPTAGGSVAPRRSSSRAIKRKKFDDDWVESPVTPTKTLALASKFDGVNVGASCSTAVSVAGTPGILTPVTPTPVLSSSGTPFSELAAAAMSYSAPPAAAAARRHKENAAGGAGGSGVIGGAAGGPLGRTKGKKRMRGKKKQRDVFEFGRFKPTDDLMLINGVLQTNDLEIVHKAVKFSCRFTLQELTERWYSLLYDSELSSMAMGAIKKLHADSIHAVQSKALFNRAEENLLATVSFSADHSPHVGDFQELMKQHPDVFLRGRTPKSLMNHWTLMKNYELLQCQSAATPSGGKEKKRRTFYDVTASLSDPDVYDTPDDQALQELYAQCRGVRREIKVLEQDVRHWQNVSHSVTGQDVLPTFDDQTVALLQGRVVCYRMKNKEASFGRAVKAGMVDMDLSLEGPSGKISRRQGIIKLRTNGDFYLHNEGKRALFVDGKPVLPGHKFKLHDNAVLQICRFIRLIFRVNEKLVSAIRDRAREMKESKILQKAMQKEQEEKEKKAIEENLKQAEKKEEKEEEPVSQPNNVGLDMLVENVEKEVEVEKTEVSEAPPPQKAEVSDCPYEFKDNEMEDK